MTNSNETNLSKAIDDGKPITALMAIWNYSKILLGITLGSYVTYQIVNISNNLDRRIVAVLKEEKNSHLLSFKEAHILSVVRDSKNQLHPHTHISTPLANVAIPVGTISSFAGPTTTSVIHSNLWKQGWLPCDGSPVYNTMAAMSSNRGLPATTSWSGASFLRLASVLKGAWQNESIEEPTFVRLPDLRGFFLRGVDGTDQGIDTENSLRSRSPKEAMSGRTGSAEGVGTYQIDTVHNHFHSLNLTRGKPDGKVLLPTEGTSGLNIALMKDPYSTMTGEYLRTTMKTGSEGRPRNASVNFIIRVW
jgi:hypothetical protein